MLGCAVCAFPIYTSHSAWTTVCVCVCAHVGVNIVRLCVWTCTYVSTCSHPHAYIPLLGKNPWVNELFIIHILLKKKKNQGRRKYGCLILPWREFSPYQSSEELGSIWTHQQFECRPLWCSNILTDANLYDWSCLLLSFWFMTV